ncbi:metallophosphoesterase [Dongia sp.]|uniref:metallophosphoesterase family protein n=1 Tax=Dongia sp. TaxID=1977262 RepID=UPI0035AFF542
MPTHRLIQVTDLHLSAERAYNYAGWAACRDHINRARPDLVVATGDLVLCDPDHGPDHAFVRSELDRIEVPWAALPGNHDIGDTGPKPYMGQRITDVRRQRFLAHIGPDRWGRDLGRWRILGMNAQLLGSDLAAEAEQLDWLEREIAAAGDRPLGLFLHKPLFVNEVDEEGDPIWCVLRPGRVAVLERLKKGNLRLVASGHGHHYRTFNFGRVAMVWAPSTALVIDDEVAPFQGLHEPGLVQYRFGDDTVEFGLVKPQGLVASDLTELVARYGAMRQAPVLALADMLD